MLRGIDKISFFCPHCSRQLRGSVLRAGSAGPCPRCRHTVSMPQSPLWMVSGHYVEVARRAIDASEEQQKAEVGRIVELIGEAGFERHARTLERIYTAKQEEVIELLRKDLPQDRDIRALVRDLELYAPGQQHANGKPIEAHVVRSFRVLTITGLLERWSDARRECIW